MKFSGTNLRAAREAAGHNRPRLAQLADTNVSTIKRAEAGLLTPRAETVARLAQALDVPLDSLFEAEEVPA